MAHLQAKIWSQLLWNMKQECKPLIFYVGGMFEVSMVSACEMANCKIRLCIRVKNHCCYCLKYVLKTFYALIFCIH